MQKPLWNRLNNDIFLHILDLLMSSMIMKNPNNQKNYSLHMHTLERYRYGKANFT